MTAFQTSCFCRPDLSRLSRCYSVHHMLSCTRKCLSSRSLPLFPPEFWTWTSAVSCQKVSFSTHYKVNARRCLSTSTIRHNAPYNILFAGSDRFSCNILETLVREGSGTLRQSSSLFAADIVVMKIAMINCTSWWGPTSVCREGTKKCIVVRPKAILVGQLVD